jgi:hypothetical protein
MLFKQRANWSFPPKMATRTTFGARIGGIHHRQLALFATGTGRQLARCSRQVSNEGIVMLGKLAGAIIGEKVAGRNKGAKGALLGVGVAALARRGFGPLAGALALGWGAKKLWEWRKGRGASFPPEATPKRP